MNCLTDNDNAGLIAMNKPQEVNAFITERHPAAVCNQCIAKGLGWVNESAHPAQITAALATTSDFTQDECGECSICRQRKKVIRSNRA
jgi:hypothetical protein